MDVLLLSKLENYCAYSERCEKDVKQKAQKLAIPESEISQYLDCLVENKFLDKNRYVKNYVESHLKRKWGKNKIAMGLLANGFKREEFVFFLQQPDENYFENLYQLALKKVKTIKADSKQEKQLKLTRFLIGKGFEYEQVSKAIKQLKQEHGAF